MTTTTTDEAPTTAAGEPSGDVDRDHHTCQIDCDVIYDPPHEPDHLTEQGRWK